jgi:hypothetical protein
MAEDTKPNQYSSDEATLADFGLQDTPTQNQDMAALSDFGFENEDNEYGTLKDFGFADPDLGEEEALEFATPEEIELSRQPMLSAEDERLNKEYISWGLWQRARDDLQKTREEESVYNSITTGKFITDSVLIKPFFDTEEVLAEGFVPTSKVFNNFVAGLKPENGDFQKPAYKFYSKWKPGFWTGAGEVSPVLGDMSLEKLTKIVAKRKGVKEDDILLEDILISPEFQSVIDEEYIDVAQQGFKDLTIDQFDDERVLGFWDSIARKKIGEMLPFIGGAGRAGDMLNIYNRAKKLQANDYPEGRRGAMAKRYDAAIINEYFDRLNQKQTTMGQSGDIMAELPAFVIEMWATGGLAAIGKKPVQKAIQKAAEKKILRKLGGETFESLLQKHGYKKAREIMVKQLGPEAIEGLFKKGLGHKVKSMLIGEGIGAITRQPGMMHRVLESTMRTKLNDIKRDENGNIDIKEQNSWLMAFVKGNVDTWVETYSEAMGPLLSPGKGLTKLGKRFVGVQNAWNFVQNSGIVKSFKGAFPKSAREFSSWLTKKGNFQGLIEEMGEERVGTFMRALFNVGDVETETYGDEFLDRIKQTWPGMDNAKAEAIGLGAPQLVRLLMAVSGVSRRNWRYKRLQQMTEQDTNELAEFYGVETEGKSKGEVKDAILDEVDLRLNAAAEAKEQLRREIEGIEQELNDAAEARAAEEEAAKADVPDETGFSPNEQSLIANLMEGDEEQGLAPISRQQAEDEIREARKYNERVARRTEILKQEDKDNRTIQAIQDDLQHIEDLKAQWAEMEEGSEEYEEMANVIAQAEEDVDTAIKLYDEAMAVQTQAIPVEQEEPDVTTHQGEAWVVDTGAADSMKPKLVKINTSTGKRVEKGDITGWSIPTGEASLFWQDSEIILNQEEAQLALEDANYNYESKDLHKLRGQLIKKGKDTSKIDQAIADLDQSREEQLRNRDGQTIEVDEEGVPYAQPVPDAIPTWNVSQEGATRVDEAKAKLEAQQAKEREEAPKRQQKRREEENKRQDWQRRTNKALDKFDKEMERIDPDNTFFDANPEAMDAIEEAIESENPQRITEATQKTIKRAKNWLKKQPKTGKAQTPAKEKAKAKPEPKVEPPKQAPAPTQTAPIAPPTAPSSNVYMKMPIERVIKDSDDGVGGVKLAREAYEARKAEVEAFKKGAEPVEPPTQVKTEPKAEPEPKTKGKVKTKAKAKTTSTKKKSNKKEPTIITDKAEVQKIKNSINEGMILLGNKDLPEAKFNQIRKSVIKSKEKIGDTTPTPEFVSKTKRSLQQTKAKAKPKTTKKAPVKTREPVQEPVQKSDGVKFLEGDLSKAKVKDQPKVPVDEIRNITLNPMPVKDGTRGYPDEDTQIDSLNNIFTKNETRESLKGVYLDVENQRKVKTNGKTVIVMPTTKRRGKSRILWGSYKAKNKKAVFPDYKNIIPGSAFAIGDDQVDADDFLSWLNGAKRASKFIDWKGEAPKVRVVNGSGNEIYFGLDLLLNTVKALKADAPAGLKLDFKQDGKNTAVVMSDLGNDGRFAVIMPMKEIGTKKKPSAVAGEFRFDGAPSVTQAKSKGKVQTKAKAKAIKPTPQPKVEPEPKVKPSKKGKAQTKAKAEPKVTPKTGKAVTKAKAKTQAKQKQTQPEPQIKKPEPTPKVAPKVLKETEIEGVPVLVVDEDYKPYRKHHKLQSAMGNLLDFEITKKLDKDLEKIIDVIRAPINANTSSPMDVLEGIIVIRRSGKEFINKAPFFTASIRFKQDDDGKAAEEAMLEKRKKVKNAIQASLKKYGRKINYVTPKRKIKENRNHISAEDLAKDNEDRQKDLRLAKEGKHPSGDTVADLQRGWLVMDTLRTFGYNVNDTDMKRTEWISEARDAIDRAYGRYDIFNEKGRTFEEYANKAVKNAITSLFRRKQKQGIEVDESIIQLISKDLDPLNSLIFADYGEKAQEVFFGYKRGSKKKAILPFVLDGRKSSQEIADKLQKRWPGLRANEVRRVISDIKKDIREALVEEPNQAMIPIYQQRLEAVFGQDMPKILFELEQELFDYIEQSPGANNFKFVIAENAPRNKDNKMLAVADWEPSTKTITLYADAVMNEGFDVAEIMRHEAFVHAFLRSAIGEEKYADIIALAPRLVGKVMEAEVRERYRGKYLTDNKGKPLSPMEIERLIREEMIATWAQKNESEMTNPKELTMWESLVDKVIRMIEKLGISLSKERAKEIMRDGFGMYLAGKAIETNDTDDGLNRYMVSEDSQKKRNAFFKKHDIDTKTMFKAGHGSLGNAYYVVANDEERILKITTSATEAKYAIKRIGQDNPRMANIIDVAEIAPYRYYILQEQLYIPTTIEMDFSQAVHILDTVVDLPEEEQDARPFLHALPKLDFNDIQKTWMGSNDMMEGMGMLAYKEKYTQLLSELKEIQQAYTDLGISIADIHDENLGLKPDGSLAAFDIDSITSLRANDKRLLSQGVDLAEERDKMAAENTEFEVGDQAILPTNEEGANTLLDRIIAETDMAQQEFDLGVPTNEQVDIIDQLIAIATEQQEKMGEEIRDEDIKIGDAGRMAMIPTQQQDDAPEAMIPKYVPPRKGGEWREPQEKWAKYGRWKKNALLSKSDWAKLKSDYKPPRVFQDNLKMIPHMERFTWAEFMERYRWTDEPVTKELRYAINEFLKNAPTLTIEFDYRKPELVWEKEEDRDINGIYYPTKDNIIIYPRQIEQNYAVKKTPEHAKARKLDSVIMHEALHGLFSYLQQDHEREKGEKRVKLTARQEKALNSINYIFNWVSEMVEWVDNGQTPAVNETTLLGLRQLNSTSPYGMTKPGELIAEMSNPRFVKLLQKITLPKDLMYNAESKNVFQSIISWLRDFFMEWYWYEKAPTKASAAINIYNALSDILTDPLYETKRQELSEKSMGVDKVSLMETEKDEPLNLTPQENEQDALSLRIAAEQEKINIAKNKLDEWKNNPIKPTDVTFNRKDRWGIVIEENVSVYDNNVARRKRNVATQEDIIRDAQEEIAKLEERKKGNAIERKPDIEIVGADEFKAKLQKTSDENIMEQGKLFMLADAPGRKLTPAQRRSRIEMIAKLLDEYKNNPVVMEEVERQYANILSDEEKTEKFDEIIKSVEEKEAALRSLRAKLNFHLPKEFAEKRAITELAVANYTKENAKKIRQIIWEYARMIGLDKEGRNRVDTLIKNSETSANFRKAVSVMDEKLYKIHNKQLKENLRKLIAEERKRIARGQNKKASGDADINARILEFIDTLDSNKQKARKQLEDMAKAIEANKDIDVTADMFDKLGDLEKTSIEDMDNFALQRAIEDIKSLKKTGTLKSKLRRSLEDRRFREIKERALETLQDKTFTPVEVIPGFWSNIRPERIARYFNNWNPYGGVVEGTFTPIMDAYNQELDAKKKAESDMKKIFAPIKKIMQGAIWGSRVKKYKLSTPLSEEAINGTFQREKSFLKGQDNISLAQYMKNGLSLNDLMFIYANSKNPQNRAHLTGTGLSDANIEEAIQLMPEVAKNAVDEAMAWFDTELYDRLNEVFRKQHNVNLPKVEDYFPIRRLDHNASSNSVVFEDAVARLGQKVGLNKDMTKQRTNSTAQFRDFDFFHTIERAIEDAEHYIAFAEPSKRVKRFLNDKSIKTAMQNKNQDAYRAMVKWLNTAMAGKEAFESDTLGNFINYMRRLVTPAWLGFNVVTLQKQLPSFMSGVGRLENKVGSSLFSLAKFVMGTKLEDNEEGMMPKVLGNELVDFVKDKSAIMRHRHQNWEREYAEMGALLYGKNWFGRIGKLRQFGRGLHKTSMSWIQKGDQMVTTVIWHAKYSEVLGNTGDEKLAIQEADRVIRDTQPMGGIVHLAEVHRTGNPYLRGLTMFTNQLNNYANLNWETMSTAQRKGFSGVSNDVIFNIVIPVMLMNMISSASINPFDDEEGLIDALMKQLFGGMFLWEPAARIMFKEIPYAAYLAANGEKSVKQDFGFGRSLKDVFVPTPLKPITELRPNQWAEMSRQLLSDENLSDSQLRNIRKEISNASAATGIPGSGSIGRAMAGFDKFNETGNPMHLIWSQYILDKKETIAKEKESQRLLEQMRKDYERKYK